MNSFRHPGDGEPPPMRTNVTETEITPTETGNYKKQNGLDYPVNVARWNIVGKTSKNVPFVRNIARQTVSTHFVFPSDVELYPR